MGKNEDRKGFALVLVVIVLSTLVAVGLPLFTAAGRYRRISKTAVARARARYAAVGALNHAIATLWRTHSSAELEQLLSSYGVEDAYDVGAFDTPDSDNPDEEFVCENPEVSLDEDEQSPLDLQDRRGVIWWSRVTDEQSRVNLNSAPPWVIANLFGVAQLARDITERDKEIELTDTSFLFSDDDEETIDGFIRIDNEYIVYRHIEGRLLKGCIRGMFLNPSKHRAGTLVWDGRAFKIPSHRIMAAPGRLTLFPTPQAIRDVSLWTRFSVIADALKYRRFYLEKMKEYGVTEEDLEEAGISPQAIAAPERDPDRPLPSRQVVDELKKLGIDAEKLGKVIDESDAMRMLGMLRWFRRMSRRGGRRNPQTPQIPEEYIEKASEFIEALENYYEEKNKFMKDYLPEALTNIKLLREVLDLETIMALQYKKVADFLTTYSYRPRDWSEPVMVVGDIPSTDSDGMVNRRRIYIAGGRYYFNRGTLIRIYDATKEEYAIVSGRGRNTLYLENELRNDYTGGATYVCAMLRHPVNINACSDDVLKALLVGLRFRWFSEPSEMIKLFRKIVLGQEEVEIDFVTPEEADAIIERIRANPPASHEDLHALLQEAAEAGEISESDAYAIFTNAVNPNSPSLIVSSMPFCYKSFDIFRIDAYGLVNDPEGKEVAREHIRAVVEVAPPRRLIWRLDSQDDFCDGIVIRYDPNSGYKWRYAYLDRDERFLITSPNDLIPYRDEGQTVINFPSLSHDPEEGDIRIETGIMPTGNKFSRHFEHTLDGEEIGSPIPLNPSKHLPTQNITRGVKGLAPGYFACWFKPHFTGGVHYFFDTGGKGDYEDRICFYYDGAELVLAVADATLERTAQEMRAPFAFQPETWYHIAASWKGVEYGDLCIFVDGVPLGKHTNYTRLAQSIDEETVEIPLEDVSALPIPAPDPTNKIIPVVRVGDEAMEVIDIDGNKLIVRATVKTATGPGGAPTTKAVRAACRGTTPKPHEAGTVVTVFGYSNRLGEEFFVGGATLTHRLPYPTPFTMVKAVRRRGALMPPTGVDESATEIPVVSTADFPNEGVIKIDDELIHYTSKNATKFLGCRRGAEGTTPSAHTNGALVALVSIGVTKTDEYKENDYIQIDDEWIKYRKAKDTQLRDRFFIMEASSGSSSPTPGGSPRLRPERGDTPRQSPPERVRPIPPVNPGRLRRVPVPRRSVLPEPPFFFRHDSVYRMLFDDPPVAPPPSGGGTPPVGPILPGSSPADNARGQEGTLPGTHEKGAKVIPVFVMREPECGIGDSVTILDHSGSSPEKAAMVINHASGNRIAFTDFLPRKFTPQPFGRLLKFPSGELPTYIAPQGFVGACAIGTPGGLTLDSKVDEIAISEVLALTMKLSSSLDAAADTLPPATVSATNIRNLSRIFFNPLLRIDDEIIGILGDARALTSGGTRIIRGMFDSTPAAHPQGSKVYILPFPSAAPFTGEVSEDDLSIPIHVSRNLPIPYIGFLSVWSERGWEGILPYRGGRGRLRRFQDVYGQPVFRNAFGSPVVRQTSDCLGVFIPYRYFDLYEPNRYSREGVYFYACKKLPHSFIKRITWDASVPQGCVLKVQVRLNEQPNWEEQPESTAGKRGVLFEFTDPDEPNLIEVTADMVEIRVYFTYINGAFESGLWKDTPILRSITLEYYKQPIFRSFEVLPR